MKERMEIEERQVEGQEEGQKRGTDVRMEGERREWTTYFPQTACSANLYPAEPVNVTNIQCSDVKYCILHATC